MENSQKILDSKYILVDMLTETKNSKVLLGYDIENMRQNIIIKILEQIENQNYFDLTLHSQSQLSNENTTQIIGGGKGKIMHKGKTSESKHYLITELSQNGELFDYILYMKKGFNEEIAKILFLQIVNGLRYYKSSFVNLRNFRVKFENIFLDENWKIKISDFFLENLNANASSEKNMFAIPNNSISFNNVYINLDLANILFSLLTGRKTILQGKFLPKKKVQLFWKTVNENFKDIKLSDEYIDLLTKLLLNEKFDEYQDTKIDSKDQDENYYEKILHHPWFKNLSIDMINSNTNNIYEKVKKEFEYRLNEVNEKKNSIQNSLKNKSYSFNKNINNEVVYRSASNIINAEFFDKNAICSSTNLNKNFYSIEISSQPFDTIMFMNELANYCLNEMMKEKKIKCSTNKLKFWLYFEEPKNIANGRSQDDDNVEDQLIVKISLCKAQQNHILNCYKINGNKFSFFEIYDAILEGVDKILSN